ncbi:MAG: ThiF family adenylyltransferase [Opitutaceae bacterium]|nr:ThiF family adenylyltransferase [Opitutaceae bacterium]
MNPIVKIPRTLLHAALADLERPHQFAGERLGFFSFRQSLDASEPLLLCFTYHSIPDEQYIEDYSVSGRISGAAIQAAMERAYKTGAGQIWVHTHGRKGIPGVSPTDQESGPKVVKSCANAQSRTLHAWAVISEHGICGQVRDIDGTFHPLRRLAVIGWPMVIPAFREIGSTAFRAKAKHPGHQDDRYVRQSFLGANAQDIIENTRVGVVGLGGGGSHLSQQLAHLGFKGVVLCDPQEIADSNLNRLVGATVEDVRTKSLKSKIAARLFRGLQPQVEIDDRPLSWEAKVPALRRCDLIFGALDSFSARRDLEAFCRNHLIPLVDIGMKILRPEGDAPEIRGQVILSLPGETCMHCLQFLTAETLAEEAQVYDKDPQPQVVWPNGILASSAIGYAIGLLTGWSGSSVPSCRMDYRGSQMTLTPSHMAKALNGQRCSHYPLAQCGDPRYEKL